MTQPPTADMVLDFVNTHPAGPHQLPERFGSANDLHAWLLERAMGSETTHVTEADAAGARELRRALITVLLAHSADKEITPEALAEAEEYLRHAATRYPLITVVTASGASLAPAQSDVPGLFGTVLANATELAQAGVWDRVRACRHQPCRLGFFDGTRNRSAVFCGPRCASRESMRAYRRRQKALGRQGCHSV
ncbi:CGNR zinc finger domain-containing protein [Streptomyces chromofuscus]|uniref:CGNR zinc finger domain-containing protein n=1 Tax=Streptomyces chromofuscus TaxID=42881 RepID=UPI001E3F04C7|nr:CGNR zinc finger domain-containing protein [Streptomyces chromofuscus]